MQWHKTLTYFDLFALRLMGKEDIVDAQDHSGLFRELVSALRQTQIYFTTETTQRRNRLSAQLQALISKIERSQLEFNNALGYLNETIFYISRSQYRRSIERRAWKREQLSETTLAIPAMTELETGQYYKWLASGLRGRGAIVEVGCWMGSSTCCLAEGLLANTSFKNRKIRAFDSFTWHNWMRPYLSADLRNSFKLRNGKAYLDVFFRFCGEYKKMIEPRRCYLYLNGRRGSLAPLEWDGEPIRLFVYDMSSGYSRAKRAWEIFSPYFIPGETIIVFNEYGNLSAQGLRFFCREQSSVLLPVHKPATSAKGFLYARGIDLDKSVGDAEA